MDYDPIDFSGDGFTGPPIGGGLLGAIHADVFSGTAGDDSLTGTDGQDTFDLSQGGSDTVTSGAGRDIFYMGGAFDAQDQLDAGPGGGGQDYDTLVLDGDYSAGVVCNPDTLAGFEQIQFVAGHDYDITLNAHLTFAYFQVLGGELGIDDHLRIDASLVDSLYTTIDGGAGADLLIGSQHSNNTINTHGGADTVIGGRGGDTINAYGQTASVFGGDGEDLIFGGTLGETVIDGGDRNDTYFCNGGFGGEVAILSADLISNIETFKLYGGAMAIGDGLAEAGDRLLFDATISPNGLDFDGSLEDQDAMTIRGSQHNDTLFGGGGADQIYGAKGDNTLSGGAGDDALHGFNGHDKLVGGAGADVLTGGAAADRFFYLALADSTAAAPDLIKDLSNIDTVYLKAIDANVLKPGNQAFHLVDALTGHAGQVAVRYDAAAGHTLIEADVDGDGAADMTIAFSGHHTGFSSFVL